MTIKNNDSRLIFLMPPTISPSGRFDIPDLSRANIIGGSGIGSIGFTNGTGLRYSISALYSELGDGSGFTSLKGHNFIVIPNSGLDPSNLNSRITKDVTISANITAVGNIFQPLLGSTRTLNGGVLWSFERNYVNSPEKCTLYISSTGVPQNITLRLGNTGSMTELTVPGALRPGIQTHVSTIVTNNFAAIYVSGILQTSTSHSTDVRTPYNLLIGGEGIRYEGYRGTLSGTLINNVAVFNAQLTSAELYDIAISGVRQDLLSIPIATPVYQDDPSLVGYWNFTRINPITDDTLSDKSQLRGVRGDRPLVINSSDTATVPFVFGQSGILNTANNAEAKITSNSSWRSALTISPSSSLSIFIIGEYGNMSYISHGTQTSSERGWELTGDTPQSGMISFRYSREAYEAFNSINSTSILSSGQVFAACAVFDGALQTVRLYVNGELARHVNSVSGISRPGFDLKLLSRFNTSANYTGTSKNNTVSQIALWNRALGSGEVRYLTSNLLQPSVNLPDTDFFAFNTSETASPIGQRHIPNGSFAYIKTLGMGFQNALQFENTFLETVSQPNAATFTSKPAAVIFRTNDTDKTIRNMKMWNSRSSALTTNWARIEYATSGTWISQPQWPSGLNAEFPRNIPATQNIFRQDGASYLNYNDDNNVSQFIYMALIFSKEQSLGQFGVGLNGKDLSFSLLYDYY